MVGMLCRFCFIRFIVVEFEMVFVVLFLIVCFICFGLEILKFSNGGVVFIFVSFLIRDVVGMVVVVFVFVILV